MTDFHNVRFPLSLAFGASGGPEFTTQITHLSNGREHRNTPHALPHRRYDAIAGIKSIEQLSELKQFFIERKGRLYSFRFLDPFDNRSCGVLQTPHATDQYIAIGDGQQTTFQLSKSYSADDTDVSRPITKPHDNSVLIAINSIVLNATNFTVDSLTGQVTLAAPPASGDIITAGFMFDTVVRFDTDFLDMTLEDFGAGQLRSLPLVELPYA